MSVSPSNCIILLSCLVCGQSKSSYIHADFHSCNCSVSNLLVIVTCLCYLQAFWIVTIHGRNRYWNNGKCNNSQIWFWWWSFQWNLTGCKGLHSEVACEGQRVCSLFVYTILNYYVIFHSLEIMYKLCKHNQQQLKETLFLLMYKKECSQICLFCHKVPNSFSFVLLNVKFLDYFNQSRLPLGLITKMSFYIHLIKYSPNLETSHAKLAMWLFHVIYFSFSTQWAIFETFNNIYHIT